MRRRTRTVLIGAAAALTLASGAGIALATGDDDEGEVPITGPALQRASDAALAHVGSGTVTATEIGDEDGYYEVEVTRADGSEVDVALTEDFTVIGDEPELPGEEQGDDD